jgi:hypothetical protein
LEIVHPNAAVFTAEWLQINVVEDRFQAGTTQESYYEALRDLVLGVLDLLGQTPIRVMGLNRDFHYGFHSEEEWHSVGHRLAPKHDWEEVLEKPGMRSLTIEGRRPDRLEGYIRVKVEPSSRVDRGIFVEINDHYQLKSDDETPLGTHEAARILTEHWMDSMQRSISIAQKIASLGDVK